MTDDDTLGRIRDSDELIDLAETRKILGDPSVSTAYEDPDLQALKVRMTPPGRRSQKVCWIRREILTLRAERVSLSEANAANVRAEVEQRVERRRTRQRLNKRKTDRTKAARAEA
ncbi:hypothetical protein QWJ07_32860 [Frankia sp. RB7]|nr:hypothetical protein [Frankia sp. RB7]